MITAGDIKVQSRYELGELLDLELDVGEGHHGKLVLRGFLIGGAEISNGSDDIINITVEDGAEGKQTVLFHGIIQETHIFSENGVRQLILSAASHDIRLDENNSRSFQDVSLTYDGIVKQILSQYQGKVSCGQESMQTGIPVVQYEETDWEFVRRMAGGMELGIFCDERAENPMVWMGRPQGGRKAVFSANAYKCCVDECYYHNGQEMGKADELFIHTHGSREQGISDRA